MIQKILISVLTSIFLVSVSFADDIHPFSATCKDNKVEAYRYSTDITGKVTDDGWSKGEKFNTEWHFKYIGGNEILLDGKPFPITAISGPCLVFSDEEEAPLGVGIWVYAINLKLKRVVASQVQASHSIIDGIKARSVSFDCDFETNKN